MLSNLLEQSLSPQPEIRHPAEKALKAGEEQSQFLLVVLELVKNNQAPAHVRQAGGVYFKNVIKSRWAEVGLTCFAEFKNAFAFLGLIR